MAPFFGASTIVWANTIGVVLVSLCGRVLGRRALRRPPPAQAGALHAGPDRGARRRADPVRRRPVPRRLGRRARRGVGGRVHRLAGRGVRAGGAAGDAARRRVAVRDPARRASAWRRAARSRAGCTRSRRSAAWSGTWSSALLLVPLLGTRRTFLVFGLACARGGAHRRAPPRRDRGARRRSSRCSPCRSARSRPPATARCWRRSTATYQYARVVEEPDGERRLELNEGQAVHSLYRPGSYLTGDYWDEFLVLPFVSRARAAAVGRDPRQRGRHDGARARPLLPGHDGRRGRDRLRADAARAQVVRPAQPAHARAPRGRAPVPAPHRTTATTRSWSTSTASRTSRSTW